MAAAPKHTVRKDSQRRGASIETGVTILFTCVGRRVSLVESFRTAAVRLGVPLWILGTDTTELSPAWHRCDEGLKVSPVNHAQYLHQLRRIVQDYQVDLLVPTVDLDLRLLAEHREPFSQLGCRVLVSAESVIDICQDKRKTHRFLRQHGFDTPNTVSVRTMLSSARSARPAWPCFIKPWDGYASRGSVVVHNRAELQMFARRIPRAVCQDFIQGFEYTCDVYVDFDQQVRSVVPRQRLEVRAGEVSKGRVVLDARIQQRVTELVTTLRAGPGVITVQLISTEDERLVFIEVNPRFGGGVPLSIEAGADFPRWILMETLGKKPRFHTVQLRDGLVMLRYDSEVWVASAAPRT